MRNEIYIKRKDGKLIQTGYASLQKEALKAIQQMSGDIWTDYNEHDPGVTVLDVLNYALTELHYKCSFPLQDYLNGLDKGFEADAFGLYNPMQVYPTGPVTKDDYRKLIFDRVKGVLNLWLLEVSEPFCGLYDILLELHPGISGQDEERIKDRVFETFHANRNIGEDLRSICIIDRQELELHGEILLEDDADASEVLGKIYMQCCCYFAPGIRYRKLQELISKGIGWDDILNGPLITRGIIDNNSVKPLKKRYHVSDLHYQIRKIKGVKSVKSIFLKSEDRVFTEEISVFETKQSYTVKVPLRAEDVSLKLFKDVNLLSFDHRQLLKSINEQRVLVYGKQNLLAGLKDRFEYSRGKYRKLKEYFSIQNDFPEFYGINEMGIPKFFSEERKGEARQLKAYLLLYDLLLATSMFELENVHQLLKLSPDTSPNRLPRLEEPVFLWDQLVDEDILQEIKEFQSGFWVEEKEKVYGVLDALYGENSNRKMLKEFDFYSRDKTDNITRRANFLKQLPRLGLEKSRGVNLLNNDQENVPGIKRWIAALMGFGVENDTLVTNVFARYSLKLVSDKEFYEDMRGRLNIDFIVDDPMENFKHEEIFHVPEMEVENPVDDYLSFKEKIYLLHHNLLFDSLLRNGIDMQRYRIISLRDEEEFLLIYRTEERKEWINLGRFKSKAEAERIANQFRQFLILLNRQSESFYMVEHLLLRSVENADGYSLVVRDSEGDLVFRLLNPMGWEKVQSLRSEVQEAFKNQPSFRIEKTKDEKFVILNTMSDDSILYCQKEFSDEETANSFLSDFAEAYRSDPGKYTQVNYQREKEVLLPSDFMDFEINVVFPSWSARFNNTKFRWRCEEILAERMPAHLKVRSHWLEVSAMQEFEVLYFNWREACANRNREVKEQTSIALCKLLYRYREDVMHA